VWAAYRMILAKYAGKVASTEKDGSTTAFAHEAGFFTKVLFDAGDVGFSTSAAGSLYVIQTVDAAVSGTDPAFFQSCEGSRKALLDQRDLLFDSEHCVIHPEVTGLNSHAAMSRIGAVD
jgi:hypothetical protein